VDRKFRAGKVRNKVLRNKQHRKVFVQTSTVLDERTGELIWWSMRLAWGC